jgi:F0F1-type ATP synthase alpha subunit
VKPFEADLYALFDARHKDLLEEIAAKKEISDDLRKRLINALDNFLSTRAPATGATQAA